MNIKTIIREEIQRFFEQQMYGIPELVNILKKQGYDEENILILKDILLKAYRQGGDPAVIEKYAEMSGVEIEAIRKGRYMFANLYDPEKL